MGVRAFRETRTHVEETVEIVESLLSCEFLGLARVQVRGGHWVLLQSNASASVFARTV